MRCLRLEREAGLNAEKKRYGDTEEKLRKGDF